MLGSNYRQYVSDNASRAVPVRVVIPSVRAQLIIRDVAEDVVEYITTRGIVGQDADEIAMAEFRGAFKALSYAEDPATADFARVTLERVNTDGAAGVNALLTQFNPDKGRLVA